MSTDDAYLLAASFAQQRLWFLERASPGTALYNIPLAWCIEGPLDADALRRALSEIVRRHEVLRTTFKVEDNELMQRIVQGLDVPWEQEDFSHVHDGYERALLRAAQLGCVSFDLSRGPLIRATLIRVTEYRHVLHIVLHHIVADGWSTKVLVRELGQLYQCFLNRSPVPLTDLPIQYGDYAVWARQRMQGPFLDAQLAYWRRTLQAAPSLLTLPLDRPRPSTASHHGAIVELDLDGPQTIGLARLAISTRSSLFVVMATLLSVLLHCYSRQDDICIGYPVANRRRAEFADLIGLFINTMVLRTRIDARRSFIDLLAQTREAILDADANQDVPFEKLVEALRPERSLSYSPLFQAMLLLQEADGDSVGDAPQLAGLQVRSLSHHTGTAKFDFTMEWVMRGGCLSGAIEYSTALFDHRTIKRMADHFRLLVDAVLRNEQVSVGDLPGVTVEDRACQLQEWNRASQRQAEERCVHELFEEQVRAQPDAVAVVCDEGQLSYRELSARANQVAHALREWGVGPDVLVGICVERGLDMVVGLLGILKAGGAYVPLDPEYPAQRLAYMLKDTAAPVLLTQQHLLASLPEHGGHTLLLDAQWPSIGQRPTTTPASLSRPEHLVYCIYTSGSTGTPKGALNTHRGFANLVRWYFCADMQAEPHERVMLSSSLSFDLTQKNVLGPLLSGATLIVPAGRVVDVDAFQTALDRYQPTRINCAPSAYRLYREQTELSALRTVVLGGEPVDAGLVAEFCGSTTTLVNSYGPTECADVAVAWVHPSNALPATLPLGRPIPNVQVYLVDQDLALLPTGVAGELCIAGVGVGRGYLNRPDLTAERFVPDPYGPLGSRMYRTGDLARYRADGCLEFLGRIDQQVKIRGQRIELGEIEAVLATHPAVREAAILARSDEGAQPRLVGYVVGEPALGQDSESLRTHLSRHLPAYMLPTAWVFLDALPLNPNGKLDRAALPAPSNDSANAALQAAPRTPTEQLLAQLWATALGVANVGIHDNFFALGGHSLLAVQLATALRKHHGFRVTQRNIFIAQDLQSLAQECDRLKAGSPLAPESSMYP